ncbi:hypothetical protein AVEN_173070-1 [Araneus ventricosus]|uniref:Uncharacterized protein n=1 Tax=Araneus ventricosus TaxID=182803 RepID=A0A4Y2HE44_ARAVE|nr:hypothetical protein AVEN_173070-1 [Araneus ventricosus]
MQKARIHGGSSVESGFEPSDSKAETLRLDHRGFADGITQELSRPSTIHEGFYDNRPQRQIIGHCGPRIIAPITSGSSDDPPKTESRFSRVRSVIGDGP